MANSIVASTFPPLVKGSLALGEKAEKGLDMERLFCYNLTRTDVRGSGAWALVQTLALPTPENQLSARPPIPPMSTSKLKSRHPKGVRSHEMVFRPSFLDDVLSVHYVVVARSRGSFCPTRGTLMRNQIITRLSI